MPCHETLVGDYRRGPYPIEFFLFFCLRAQHLTLAERSATLAELLYFLLRGCLNERKLFLFYFSFIILSH